MIGDSDDMLGRLKAVLPGRWFADETPVLDGVLSGFAATGAWVYRLLQAAKTQTRRLSASGGFLDMIAGDFCGSGLSRHAAEGDDALRGRIGRALLREHGTRSAVTSVLLDLTGRAPAIFEPMRPADTGAWNRFSGYGVAGGWGSLSLPFQCFITAYRPNGSGIGIVAGWGRGAGGYGRGAIEYASLAMLSGQVTDADIDAAVASVMPAATIAWTRIST